jgi:hypothetical protein
MPFFASPERRARKTTGSFLTPVRTPDRRETDGGFATHAKSLSPFYGPVLAAISLRPSPAPASCWSARSAYEAWL